MSRIIKILLTALLLWRLGLASTKNHQLSSSISPVGSDSGGSSRSSSRTSQSWPQKQHQHHQQHVDGEGKLIDNKLRDKLLSYIGGGGVDGDREYRRAKRDESIFTEDKINKYDDNRINDEQPQQRGEVVPRVTEEVLQISNLTEERIREEKELLDHLNREHFLDSSSPATGIQRKEEADGAGAPRKKHPGGGKKGRRRKGHKKKIKRIKPTAVGSFKPGWNSNVPASDGGQRWRNEQINSSLTGITKLSLNESEQQQKQNQKPGRKKHRQKSSSPSSMADGDGAKKMTTSQKSSFRSESRDKNWARKAGQALVVLNSDDIYDGNMQITVERDDAVGSTNGGRVEEYFPSEGDSWRPQQRDQRPKKLTPEEREARRQKKLEKQRKQLKKFKQEELLSMPPPEQLQQLPPAPATEPSPGVSSVTFASDDMLRTEAVSLQRIVIVGDLSCMKDDFIPAPAIPNADIKYLRNDVYGLENSFLEAEYHCRSGYELRYSTANGNNSNLICRKSRWIGKRPVCVRIKRPSLSPLASAPSPSSPSWPSSASLAPNEESTAVGMPGIAPAYQNNDRNLCGKKHNCQQGCYMKHNGTRVCSCFKGFKMVDGRCVDINECVELGEDVCEYGCSNTIGSFTCKCPKGLRVADNNKCMDVNECLLRNGHGPCQDTCINTWSGYRCSCSGLPGTRLSDDGHSCEDIDECTVNNGGCSHTCLNTLGRAFCVCPEGYMLDDDWKTCVDIDECSNQKSIRQEFRCSGRCVNTVGSYRCLLDDADEERGGQNDDDRLTKQSDDELNDESDDDNLCPTGYFFNTTMGDCQDTNECSQGNGGCQHHCVNSDGSFYCSCKYGFKLDVDKHNCLALNDSLKLADVACPPLFPPRHGYLECSRPIDEISDGPNGGRLKIINRPGSQCILKCPTGYRLEGKYSKICGTTGEWMGDESGTCIRYPQPKLTCPTSVNVELHPTETDQTAVKLRRPKTDVSWERDIVVDPFWAKKDVLLLPLGSVNISYTAKHPVSKLTSSCTFVINVMAGRPPTVDFCPDTQIYTIEGRHQSVKATWEEPIFSDNVGVVTITKSNSPGTDFGAGSHLITYEAHDEAEWSSKCVFKIVVNVSKRKDVQHFQLPILYNRFYF